MSAMPEAPHNLTPEQLAEALNSDLRNGISAGKAKARLRRKGANLTRAEFSPGIGESIRAQCKGLSVLLLFFTALILYLFDPQTPYLITVFAVPVLIVCNAAAEAYASSRLNSVKKKAPPGVTVIRGGKELRIDARGLVPGDVILLANGALVPADSRIIEDDGDLTVLETPVSGVRSPAEKSAVAFTNDREVVHENMLYAGTILTSGSCRALVCFTGADTLTRQIHASADGKTPPRLPLALRQTREYSRFATLLALISTVLLILVGILRGKDPGGMFLIAVAAGAASLCDSVLPLVFLAFSEGLSRMADDGFLVRNTDKPARIASLDTVMSAKEEVLPPQKLELCAYRTDKRVRYAGEAPGEEDAELLRLFLVCSDFPREQKLSAFDRAVLEFLRSCRIPEEPLTAKWFRVDTMRNAEGEVNAVLSLHDDHNHTVVKGLPEAVLSRCAGYAQNGKEYRLDGNARRRLLADAEALTHDNAYVIAIASGMTSADSLFDPTAERKLIWRGLLAFRASVGADAANAVYRCLQAGLRPIMSTSDPYYTAVSLGKSTGIIRNEGQVISSPEIEAMDYGMFVLNAERYFLYLEPTDEQWHQVMRLRKEAGHEVAVIAHRQEELPMLKDADVSVTPTSSCDALRESADVLIRSGGLRTVVGGVLHARDLCLRIRRLRQYTFTGFLTLFLLTFAGAVTGNPALRVQELLFGGLLAGFACALVLATLPTDRRMSSSAVPPLRNLPEKADLLRELTNAVGIALILFVGFLLTKNHSAAMAGYVLSQFLLSCAPAGGESAFDRKRFGHRRQWTMFFCLAAIFALLVLVPFLRAPLGFDAPTLSSLLPTLLAVTLWYAAVQLLLRKKKTKTEKNNTTPEKESQAS